MPLPIRICYITDRKSFPTGSWESFVLSVIRAGIDLIQVREKDLPTRELLAVTRKFVDAAKGTATRIVVNGRLDVALAAGAAGVHLGNQSLPGSAVRRIVSSSFLVGASCHSLEEAKHAEASGADYIAFGPVFETASKLQYGPSLGLAKLREAAEKVSIPVLALGGINVERVKSCLDAGAAGVAGISIFQSCDSIEARAQELRSLFDPGNEPA